MNTQTLVIRISDSESDDHVAIPYTNSPLDTCRGGKGKHVKRKEKDSTGDGKKDKKAEKTNSRH
jgi:hypothetical protein